MVEAAGIEPASKIIPIVVIHKLIQFLYHKLTKIDGYEISLTILLR